DKTAKLWNLSGEEIQSFEGHTSSVLIAHITYLPTMAATAWYHGKVDRQGLEFEEFLSASRSFATDDLLPALFKGNTLSAADRDRIAERLAYFTGLSPEYIKRAKLRVQGFRFAKELLREQGLAVGLLDSRYTQDQIDDLSADPEGDAASDAISGAYLASLMDYLRHDLKVDWNRRYLAPAAAELSSQWRWSPLPEGQSWEPMPVNTTHDLSAALRVNPSLKVLVASGYYDLVTPFFDAEYTLNRHDIDAERIIYKYYGGGHMMYVNEPSRTQLLEDVREFIRQSL
ncbi:MAG: serine carboxypeptidase, partial [Pseudomonadota bacterium]